MLEADAQKPLLLLEGACIEAGGVRGAPLDARGGSRRLTLVGDFRPLFRLLTANATLTAGRAELYGVPVREAARTGFAGVALLDPPLVNDFTLERYLDESARLLGLDAPEASRATQAVIEALELGPFARHRLGRAHPALRQRVPIAQALLGTPEVVCLEAPFSGLDPATGSATGVTLERALGAARLVLGLRSLPSEGVERAWLERSDWVMVEAAGRIVEQGPPGKVLGRALRYVAILTRGREAFVSALAARGISVPPGAITPLPTPPDAPPGAAPFEIFIELPPGKDVSDVVSAASEAGTPLVELTAS